MRRALVAGLIVIVAGASLTIVARIYRDGSLEQRETEIGRLLAALGLASEEDTRRFGLDLWHQYQAMISRCMAEAGFEYLPVPAQLTQTDPAEYFYSHGFGITEALVGLAVDQESEAEADPNEQITRRLTVTEQRRYVSTLPECSDQAGSAIFGMVDRLRDLFEEELQVLNANVHTDPSYTTALRAWATCAADAGVDGPQRPSELPAWIGDVLTPKLEAILSSAETSAVSDALAYEKELALAIHGCNMELDQILDALKQAWIRTFVREHYESLRQASLSLEPMFED